MFVEPCLHAGVFRIVDGGSGGIVTTTGGFSILHLLQRPLAGHSGLHPLHPLHTRSCRLRRHPRFFDAPQVQAYLTGKLLSLRHLYITFPLQLARMILITKLYSSLLNLISSNKTFTH